MRPAIRPATRATSASLGGARERKRTHPSLLTAHTPSSASMLSIVCCLRESEVDETRRRGYFANYLACRHVHNARTNSPLLPIDTDGIRISTVNVHRGNRTIVIGE